ncbi:hypothetical protein R1flu_017182 [Riccia fluitans]|uniref:Uncharacterized protein n=1 Tax=Riccia fluitans TaxID=41844 RepID=A0ABD1XE03_9MARC
MGTRLWGRALPRATRHTGISNLFSSLGAVGKTQKPSEAGRGPMAEAKESASPFRLLFAGVGVFPTAVSRTCHSLEGHPQIHYSKTVEWRHKNGVIAADDENSAEILVVGLQVDCLAQDEIRERIHEYDMCVCRMERFDRDILSRATRLKLITQFGMGLEGVDVEAATEMGIKVARIPSAGSGNALSCAEHTIYLILSFFRNQKAMIKSIQDAKIGEPEGRTLFGCTVLLVGFGSIGQELAPRLKPFGVRILAVRPSWNQKYSSSSDNLKEVGEFQMSNGTSKKDDIVDERGGTEHLHEFLSRSDIVVLCCPQTPKTKGMVNEAFLSSMKQGALLVNVARGGLMEYEAVTSALESGKLGGLATDVTWVEPIDPKDPIINHPNVIITPHIAGVTEFSYTTMGQIVAMAAIQLYEGREITDLEFVN